MGVDPRSDIGEIGKALGLNAGECMDLDEWYDYALDRGRTHEQALAYARNRAEARLRATGHETGAVRHRGRLSGGYE